MTNCSFSKDNELWKIQTESGDVIYSNGSLRRLDASRQLMYPIFPGVSRFKGHWYHTGNWPHTDLDFKGLRVGQIGTGSTGIQAAPEIAKTCEHLTVFQRTPNYSIPARNTQWNVLMLIGCAIIMRN